MNGGEIINLNVGGKRFSTSSQTLTWISDTFFTSLLSGRISSMRDEKNFIFIDRDPSLFGIILNYLRTKDIDISRCDIRALRHEAEFYNITPLIKRLMLIEDLNQSSCGDVLFTCYLPAPIMNNLALGSDSTIDAVLEPHSNAGPSNEISALSAKPGSMVRIQSTSNSTNSSRHSLSHSRNSSWDLRSISTSRGWATSNCSTSGGNGHSRTASLDLRHSRQSSADLKTLAKNDIGLISNSQTLCTWPESLKVQIIKAHHNWILVSYAHFVNCYRLKDSGWQLIFTSPSISPNTIERVAINAKGAAGAEQTPTKMIAISYGSQIRLWGIQETGEKTEVGTFNLSVRVEYLFFIGSQLVALSSSGKIGVWHYFQSNWQTQDLLCRINNFDSAGFFLLLGCNNGSIYYIDMQKFPLRMKDNDLLVTELYKDPVLDAVTAISVYLTPKTSSLCGNWIEIAYGTKNGSVRVIVQHPETVGHGPQLFQTFTVHRNPVTKVTLSEKYLISVCSDHHVRTWSVTRFRGMISTQPGSTPLKSFKILSLEGIETSFSYVAGNDFGPFGEQDDEQVFVQKIVPETDKLFVRLASNGRRICIIKSVDGSSIACFCVHECEGTSRMGSRFLLTGHFNGSVQMWDLSTALNNNKNENVQLSKGGPSAEELLTLLDQCEISHNSTPCISPCLSSIQYPRLKSSNTNIH